MDLVRLFCAGVESRFSGVFCEFYERLAAECGLLRKEKLEQILKRGRCNPYQFLKSAIRKNLARYKDIIDVKEYVSSLAFELSKRLTDIRINKGYNLPVLIGYINRTAYTEVIKLLQSEGVLERRMCGSCVFLSELKPNFCRRENIEVMEDGVSQLKKNPFYMKERKKKDKCREGFHPHSFISLNRDENSNVDDTYNSGISNYSEIENSTNKIEIEKINDLLKKRAIDTKHINTQTIYKRQHSVFVNLYKYISEGYSVSKAVQLIATKIGKNVKTIERDINEIRSFLTKELVYI